MTEEFLDEQIERLNYNKSTPNWIHNYADLSGKIRYIQIKSCYNENIAISQREGIWATTPKNTLKLLEAYLQVDHLILIFSVNSSRKFYGYARMESLPQESLSKGHFGPMEQRFLGPCFKIRWLNTQVISFTKLEDITNELNENLPVKISRDGQELSAEAGARICQVLDEGRKESLDEEKELSGETVSNSDNSVGSGTRRIAKSKFKWGRKEFKIRPKKKQEW